MVAGGPTCQPECRRVDAVDLPPLRFAALVAPVVDRVVIGVHLRAQPRGRELFRSHGLERGGSLVEFRAALPSGPVARRTLEAVSRYFPDGGLDDELAYQAEQATLEVHDDGSVTATDRGRVVIDGLYDVHANAAGDGWATREADLPRLAELGKRLLVAARPTAGPAFAGMGQPHERPGDPPALVLFNRLAALRYHRADAHAASWAAAGHTAESINAIEAGPERDAIEAETNRRAAPPFAALSPDERLTLLAGLAALPG